ncbi:MAG: hypothetical protein ACUVWJ_08790 [Spirochaetota bacterium]
MKSALFCSACIALLFAYSMGAHVYANDDHTFDLSEVEKKPFALGGYTELAPTISWLDQDASLYMLQQHDRDVGAVEGELGGRLQLEASLEKGMALAYTRTLALGKYSTLGWEGEAILQEAYLRIEPSASFSIIAGKITFLWGKGYAWNQVAFVDRPKSLDEPEASREGFVSAAAGYVRSFSGPLGALSLTTVLIPVYGGVNEDFGSTEGLNLAARLYLLLFNTDIALNFLSGESQTTRAGVDFSRNLASNFELHGELAHITDQRKTVVDSGGFLSESTTDTWKLLMGARYLTRTDTTFIVEYYHNGDGLSTEEMQSYFNLILDGYEQYLETGDDTLLNRAQDLSRGAYGTSSPMTDYLYLHVSQNEPFGILYLTPAVNGVVHLMDGSFSLSPEIAYSGITNLELRLRATFLAGDRGSEYGEKPADTRLEARARYYF